MAQSPSTADGAAPQVGVIPARQTAVGVSGGSGFPIPADEAERLALLAECQILDTPLDPDFDDLTRLAAHICGTPIALVSLVDETRQWFKSRMGVEVSETPRRLAFCAHAIPEPSQIMVVPDATKDARFADNELVTGAMGIRFYAGAPLVLEGHALGTLCVIDRSPHELTTAQREALAALARQVVQLIRLSRKNLLLQKARIEQAAFFTRPLDMLCVAGADGYFKVVNPAFIDTLGFSSAELCAFPYFDLIHPEDVASARAQLGHAGQGLPVVDFECRFRCKDGSYRWLNWKCAPAADGILHASARDVTVQKEMAATLAAQEEVLRQFVRYTPAAVAMLDTEMHYLQASERWMKDYHLEGQEILGRSHYEVFPDLPEGWKAIHRRCLAGAVDRCDEAPFPRADGSVEWLQWEVRPWHKVGDQIGGLIFFTQVITERKRTEELLLASERRFRNTIEHSGLGVAVAGVDGRFQQVNRTLCEMIGRTEDEVLRLGMSEITHPEDIAETRAQVSAFLASDADYFQCDKRFVHQDGHTVWVSVTATAVRDAQGRKIQLLHQIEDITRRRETEERLKASLVEKDTLLQELHHRVKNNLQVVHSLLSLQSDSIQNEQALAAFRDCQRRIRAMALIHEQLYRSENLSRVELPAYLKSLAGSVLGSYGHASHIGLEFDLAPVRVNVDSAVPLALFTNEVLANALKHAFPQGRAGAIRITLQPGEAGRFIVRIEDDGVGLPAGAAERTDTLGLRLLSMLAGQLHAVFDIQSEPGRTCFCLDFPAAVGPATGSPTD